MLEMLFYRPRRRIQLMGVVFPFALPAFLTALNLHLTKLK